MDARRPSYLTLIVADLERARTFYEERLRLPVKLSTEGWLEMQTEGVILVLVEGKAVAGDSPVLGWEVGDLDAEARALEERGIAVEGEARVPCGRRRRFRDPDGHVLELLCFDAPGDAPEDA